VLWSLFTVMAVLSGLGAVAVVQSAIAGSAPEPLSSAQVSAELGAVTAGPAAPTTAPPTSQPGPTASSGGKSEPGPTTSPGGAGGSPGTAATPSGSPRPSKSPSSSATGGSSGGSGTPGQTRVLTSRGGSVVASCQSGQVYLRSWSPAPGYTVDEVERGPADGAEIKFQSTGGPDDEVKMHLTCRSGVPTSTVEGDREHRD